MPSGTNVTGDVYGIRQGSAEVVHTYPVAFNTPGMVAAAVLVGTIKASAHKPVHVEVSFNLITAFNGTTPAVTAGTSSNNANEWLAAGDITEATPGYYPAANAVTKFRLVADTPIYVKNSAADSTTGAGVLIVKEFSENTKAIA